MKIALVAYRGIEAGWRAGVESRSGEPERRAGAQSRSGEPEWRAGAGFRLESRTRTEGGRLSVRAGRQSRDRKAEREKGAILTQKLHPEKMALTLI